MEQQIQSYVCPNCGGNLQWNIRKQSFECVSCRTPSDVDLTGEPICQHPIHQFYECVSDDGAQIAESIQCKNCGATILFDGNMTATTCPMCGSPQINVAKQNLGARPDGIIPFTIDRADAQEAFRKWAKSRWFAPNAFKKSFQEGRLKGVYLPCWTYDADADAHYTGRGGRTRVYKDKDGETHTETEWYPVSGYVSTHADDLMVYDGTTEAKAVLSDGNKFFDTENDALPYLPPYLSGFNAEHYQTGAVDCFERVKPPIESTLRGEAHSDILRKGYDQASVSSLNTSFSNVEYKHMLLPVWISAFAFKGKQYTYLINGKDGRVTGKRPYSPIKIALLIIALVAVAVGAYFLLRDNKSGKQTKQNVSYQVIEYAETVQSAGSGNVFVTQDGRYQINYGNAA